MTPLEKFFSIAWGALLDQEDWAGPDLQNAMEAAGLVECRVATMEDTKTFEDQCIVVIGSSIIVLTPAGREALAMAKI